MQSLQPVGQGNLGLAHIITVGRYEADVIAFDVNPLDDISVWGNPNRVTHIWKAGSLVKAP